MVIITNTIVIKLSISSMNSIIISIMISNVNLLVELTNKVSLLQKTEHNNAPPFVFLIICVPWSSWSWTGRVFLIRHHSLFYILYVFERYIGFPTVYGIHRLVYYLEVRYTCTMIFTVFYTFLYGGLLPRCELESSIFKCVGLFC